MAIKARTNLKLLSRLFGWLRGPNISLVPARVRFSTSVTESDFFVCGGGVTWLDAVRILKLDFSPVETSPLVFFDIFSLLYVFKFLQNKSFKTFNLQSLL